MTTVTQPRNIIIKPDGTVEEYLPAGETYTLEELKKAIGGGYLQLVATVDNRLMWCDEEGKLKGFPLNETASRLYIYGHSDPIVGDVLVCDAHLVE